MKSVFVNFKGIVPAVDPRSVKDEYALIVNNADTSSSKLVPVRNNANGVDLPQDSEKRGMWHWGDVDYVSSPLNEDKYERIYYTMDGRLYHKGTFGERRIYTERPTAEIETEVASPLEFSASSFSFLSGWMPQNQEGTIQGVTMNGNIVTVRVRVDGYYITDEYGSLEIKYPKEVGMISILTANGIKKRRFNFEGSNASFTPILASDSSDNDYARIDLSAVRIIEQIDPKNGAVVDNGGVYYGAVMELDLEVGYTNGTGNRYYTYTTVDDIGQESPTSELSELVTARVGDTVNLTMRNLDKTLSAVRIYRSAGSTETNSASFYFVTEVDLSLIDQTISLNAGEVYHDTANRIMYSVNEVGNIVAYFTEKETWVTMTDSGLSVQFGDNIHDNELAEEHLDVQNPPDGIYALNCIHGSLVAAQENNIWFSEPYMAFDWNAAYNRTTASKIVGLAVNGQTVFALTEGFPELLSGTHPGTMTQIRSPFRQACTSKKSIVTADGMVIYASPDGLVGIDESGACIIITEGVLSRDQWQRLDPSSMVCAVHDKDILIFTRERCIVYNIATKAFTTDDTIATDVYSDTASDTLYLNGDRSWRTDDTHKRITWRSGVITSARPFAFSVARVILSPQNRNTGIFRLYSVSRDSVTDVTDDPYALNALPCHARLVAEIAIPADERSFRLPFMRKELEWVCEIESESKVISVELATSMGEL